MKYEIEIPGVPEGYRLGKVVYPPTENNLITFRLEPDEQPKKLEAVIVVELSGDRLGYDEQLLRLKIRELGYKVSQVTIRERGSTDLWML